MRRIVHHKLGEPAQMLRVDDDPSPALGPDQVRIRVSYAPIHPGDLLGVMGSPAFGTPPTIGSGGRVPGFEGAGVVSEVGDRIDRSLGLKPGLRVAFFPALGSWRDEVVVPAGSVVPLPGSIPDEVGAQMLINTATALTAIRAAQDSLPPEARTGVVMLLTGAGSAVQGLQFLPPISPAGRTALGWPPRGRGSTSRSIASAGVCWAISRSYWRKGPGPSSISARSAERRATSVFFLPIP
jgi:NADPH:quinone reductase-like Zn-dependent oxidoreductase